MDLGEVQRWSLMLVMGHPRPEWQCGLSLEAAFDMADVWLWNRAGDGASKGETGCEGGASSQFRPWWLRTDEKRGVAIELIGSRACCRVEG